MKRFQYLRLEEAIKTNADIGSFIPTSGKHKDKAATFLCLGDRYFLRLLTADQQEFKVHYGKVEHAGADGRPMIVPVQDMTGREIDVDSWICYSQGTSYSHSLQIGKVSRVTPTGGLIVKRYLRDGKKVGMKSYWTNETNVNDPDRCIKLPIDPATMMMWIMKDFDGIKE